MKAPTPEEIRLAIEAVRAEGPAAEITIQLGVLVFRNPQLQAIFKAVHHNLPDTLISRAAIAGALMQGLNVGLRIGEARSAAAKANA